MRIVDASESSVIAYLGDKPTSDTSEKIFGLAEELKAGMTNSLVDLIPSYNSLLVIFDPLETDHLAVRKILLEAASMKNRLVMDSCKRVILPVYYHEEVGEDLLDLATKKRLSIDELISLHSNRDYRVYAIGFAPGFAFLGEVDERLEAPRLSTPRSSVPRGSVAIADLQTAVYPSKSPGGWNLIGRCPTQMFDPISPPFMPCRVGDTVRFEAIDRKTYLSLGGAL